ncbi:hypothetical protein E2C01_076049 [Portunus trituberculatus]|uniref:Uncharacterized protein n=1 Tax=Portunus trituberculatus TaxID=210409 RepID=A0A5B7IGH8_PORTR|nr:hypothetical protein [Portunus trituberculatus]
MSFKESKHGGALADIPLRSSSGRRSVVIAAPQIWKFTKHSNNSLALLGHAVRASIPVSNHKAEY